MTSTDEDVEGRYGFIYTFYFHVSDFEHLSKCKYLFITL